MLACVTASVWGRSTPKRKLVRRNMLLKSGSKEYPLVNVQKNDGKCTFLIGKSLNQHKSTINGPCSIAMLNYQRVLFKKDKYVILCNYHCSMDWFKGKSWNNSKFSHQPIE